MSDWLMTKGLKWVGRLFNGWKMRAGGAGFLLSGIVGILGILFPDQGLPVMPLDKALEMIFGGVAVIGGAHKMEKQTEATVQQTQAINETAPRLDPEIIGADAGGPG